MKSRNTRQIGERFATAGARRWALIAFVTIVALTGGGSRSDILSLVVLRPVAVMFAAYAILAAPRGAFAEVRTPLLLLALLAGVVGLHLVPLPPGAWHALPLRGPIESLDAVLGVEDAWRPLAMSPAGAWNALFSLAVPAAAILLYAALDRADRHLPLSIWVWVAFASATLGIAQMLGSPQGALYLYAVTNVGSPVGLFANANHQAVIGAIAIPLAIVWASRRAPSRIGTAVIGSAGAFTFLSVALLTGSRAGAAAAMAGTAIAILLLAQDRTPARAGKGRSGAAHVVGLGHWRPGAVNAGLVLAAAAAIALVLYLSPQGLGYSALMAGGAQEELRLAALPTVLDLLREVWVTGVGSGSFAKAFGTVEPVTLLQPSYLNHAHNDWLEVLIEYGLAGAALLVMLGVYTARSIRRAWSRSASSQAFRLALICPPAILAAASLVDYPLRVPLVQVLAVLWLLALATGALPGDSRSRRRG